MSICIKCRAVAHINKSFNGSFQETSEYCVYTWNSPAAPRHLGVPNPFSFFFISAEEAHCCLLGMTQAPDKHRGVGGIHNTFAADTMSQGGVCSRGGAAPPPSG